jgi:Zn finger protein HypA/HybF involved in hydrogenase expression
MPARKIEEFVPSHRIVDRHGFDIGEVVMKIGNQYFTREAFYHNEKPETEETLRQMGWHAVSSFRNQMECHSCGKSIYPQAGKFSYCECGASLASDT